MATGLEYEFPSVQLEDRSLAWEKEWNCNLQFYSQQTCQDSCAKVFTETFEFCSSNSRCRKLRKLITGSMRVMDTEDDSENSSALHVFPWLAGRQQLTIAEAFAAVAGAVAAVFSLSFGKSSINSSETKDFMTQENSSKGSLPYSEIAKIQQKRKFSDMPTSCILLPPPPEHTLAPLQRKKENCSKSSEGSKNLSEIKKLAIHYALPLSKTRKDREERKHRLDEKKQRIWEVSRQVLEARKISKLYSSIV